MNEQNATTSAIYWYNVILPKTQDPSQILTGAGKPGELHAGKWNQILISGSLALCQSELKTMA